MSEKVCAHKWLKYSAGYAGRRRLYFCKKCQNWTPDKRFLSKSRYEAFLMLPHDGRDKYGNRLE